MNGFDLGTSVSALTVFLQGLLSFFSPCVLPLLPVYIGYLAGGTLITDENGQRQYSRKKTAVNTLFFVLGIAAAFFILGLGFSALGLFFKNNRLLFARIGGVIVILFGLYQLGIFGDIQLLSAEKRFRFSLDKLSLSPITALVFGFLFSFSWTPCVGPVLSGVLLMASSAGGSAKGFLLIGVYTLGFVLPFLAAGLLGQGVLSFFKKHQQVIKYTTRIGGVLLILMGIMMLTGTLNTISSYLSSLDPTNQPHAEETAVEEVNEPENSAAEEESKSIPAPDFELTDQYGNIHKLSDYQGKVVFLNFWATWCPPCRNEMPDIQALYEELQEAGRNDVVILSIAFPGLSGETDTAGITAFLEENGYTYPALMDEQGGTAGSYYITAFPTTFMISADGSVYGYLTGGITKEIMYSIIDQTVEGK